MPRSTALRVASRATSSSMGAYRLPSTEEPKPSGPKVARSRVRCFIRPAMRPAMRPVVRPAMRSLRSNHTLPLAPQPIDAQLDDVTHVEIGWRALPQTHTRGRAGADYVAGHERHVAADITYQVGNAEYQFGCLPIMLSLAFYFDPHD